MRLKLAILNLVLISCTRESPRPDAMLEGGASGSGGLSSGASGAATSGAGGSATSGAGGKAPSGAGGTTPAVGGGGSVGAGGAATAGAGGSAGTAGGAPVAGASYFTDFDLTESPISEGGVWQHHLAFWTSVATMSGHAYGTQAIGPRGDAEHYNDSYAYLNGFPPDHRVELTLQQGTLDPSCTHEVEMLLRFDDTNGVAPRGYECIIGIGYTEIVRWEGQGSTLANFSYLVGPGGNDSAPKHGDRYRGDVIGDVISVYKWNGNDWALVVTATDTSAGGQAKWPDGGPGIGLYRGLSGCGSLGDYGATSFLATSVE